MYSKKASNQKKRPQQRNERIRGQNPNIPKEIGIQKPSLKEPHALHSPVVWIRCQWGRRNPLGNETIFEYPN